MNLRVKAYAPKDEDSISVCICCDSVSLCDIYGRNHHVQYVPCVPDRSPEQPNFQSFFCQRHGVTGWLQVSEKFIFWQKIGLANGAARRAGDVFVGVTVVVLVPTFFRLWLFRRRSIVDVRRRRSGGRRFRCCSGGRSCGSIGNCYKKIQNTVNSWKINSYEAENEEICLKTI